MKQEFNPRNFLRAVPKDLLRQYFDRQDVLENFDWDAPQDESEGEDLYGAWQRLPFAKRKAMSVDFQRVEELASRQGIQTILTVGRTMPGVAQEELEEVLRQGRSNIQKVFRVLLQTPEIFDIACRFAWADNLRRYWFHRRDLPAVEADISEVAKSEIKAAISEYYQEKQCRGEYCHVDHQVRGDLHYWMVYLSDHPTAENCFEGSDELRHQVQQRAFDVVFIFNNKGELSMYAEGGAELRTDLAVKFARHILKREIKLDAVAEPVFDLGVLKDPSFRFKIDPSDGIASMRLLSMKLAPPDSSGDRVTLATSTRSHPSRLHGWMKRSLNPRELPLASMRVEHVEIQATLQGSAGRTSSVRFSLTANNACSLKDTPEHDGIKSCLRRSEVMLTSPLDRLLKRVDVQDHRLSNDEVNGWPKDDHKQIRELGLIRVADNADALPCEECGESHGVEDVGGRPAVQCPKQGLTPVVPERLRQWEVDADRLASLCANSLFGSSSITGVQPGRLWLLGKKGIGGRDVEIFLARGSHWGDGVEVLQKAPRLQNSPAPIILIPNRLPDEPEWQHRGRALFPLSEIARLDDSGLVVKLEQAEGLYSQIAARLDEAIVPTRLDEREGAIAGYQKSHNNCARKEIHQWAAVDAADFNRWKNGDPKVPDGSEPAKRIEKLLQFDIKSSR